MVKIRRKWAINPVTMVKKSKKNYVRKKIKIQFKEDLKKELN